MPISVSVIIPTYNRWPIVCRAIDSVLQQTYPAAEIIVIDDGSTDGSANFLKSKYNDKISLYIQPNAGVSAARNLGLSKAQGNWIALLDSDDEWLPQKLQNQIAVINEDPSCVLSHTEEIWIRNGVRVNQMNKHKKSGGEIFEQCLPMCAISPSSALIKANLFDAIGNFDESLPACEDYDLWLRICAEHRVRFIEQAMLVKYGGHDDQLSRKHWGMDRFRIRSLQNLLINANLNNDQRAKTLQMLERKTRILLKGAIKHSNEPLIIECQDVLERYKLSTQENSPEPPSC